MKSKSPRRPPENASYQIGYCKPPTHSRFKPGQCGCPSGRRGGRRNLATVAREALQKKVTIQEGDRTRKVSKMDAIIQVTLNKALKGDAKALVAFFQLVRSAGLMDEEPETSSTESLSVEDQAILVEYLERHGVQSRALDEEEAPAETETDRKEPKAKGREDEEPEDKA
jgi:hypothetical protein